MKRLGPFVTFAAGVTLGTAVMFLVGIETTAPRGVGNTKFLACPVGEHVSRTGGLCLLDVPDGPFVGVAPTVCPSGKFCGVADPALGNFVTRTSTQTDTGHVCKVTLFDAFKQEVTVMMDCVP